MEKIWMQVYDWPEYEVSNYGEIKRINKNCGTTIGKILKPIKLKNGYLKVALCRNSKRKEYLVHRLVMSAFVWISKLQVNHKNWFKNDNRLENLEYCTASENSLHRFKVLWHKSPMKWKFWKYSKNSKKVNQYDLEWNFIKTWDSIHDIYRFYDKEMNHISSVCTGKRNQAYGFKWSHYNEKESWYINSLFIFIILELC